MDDEKIRQLKSILRQAKEAGGRGVLLRAHEIALSLQNPESAPEILADLAGMLSASGAFKEAQELVSRVDSPFERTHILVELASGLTSQGRRQDALMMLQEAGLHASLIEGRRFWNWQKAEALDRLAVSYSEIGLGEQALALWKEGAEAAQSGQESDDPQEIFDCSGVLSDIALNLAHAGFHDNAADIARSIKVTYRREGTLNRLSEIAGGP
jgi:tetratricopeptide (TPR) repeat protein